MAVTFIIGGGPSARDVDTATLRHGLRIAVNDAASHKPADVFFSNDHNYVLNNRERIDAFGIPVHVNIWDKDRHRFAGWPSVTAWRRRTQDAPSAVPGELSSGPVASAGCSGYVAINLAVQMGARRIVLFGYDFHDPYAYFFNADPFPRKHIVDVRRTFTLVAQHYRAAGVQIVNASPGSAIGAFEIMSPREAIAWSKR